jgi:hypothetical protein
VGDRPDHNRLSGWVSSAEILAMAIDVTEHRAVPPKPDPSVHHCGAHRRAHAALRLRQLGSESLSSETAPNTEPTGLDRLSDRDAHPATFCELRRMGIERDPPGHSSR